MEEMDFEKMWPGKWFVPIVERLAQFEDEMGVVFPDWSEAAFEASPGWSLQCLINGGIKPYTNYHGIGDIGHLDTRTLGKIIGAKWSFSECWTRSAGIWPMLNLQQTQKIEAVWGEGFVAEAIEFTQKYADELAPKFKLLQRGALDLAEQQNFKDLIDYQSGFARGLETPRKIWELMIKSAARITNEQKRLSVLSFGFFAGEIIEEHKAESSWAGVHEAFNEFTKHQIEVDEDTLKKILQRAGLKGVGKAGRPSKV